MAFVEGSNDGVLNDTTPVTLVAAPAGGVKRLVRSVRIANNDSADVVLTYSYKHGADSRVVWKGTLNPGDTLVDDTVYVLDDTDKTITAVLGGAVAATQPSFVASYGDDS